MSKEEAIDWLARVKSNTVNHTLEMPLWWNEPLAEVLEMAIKALEQEPRWIPVSEELPKESVYKEFVEPSKSVLVQLNNGEMKVSRYWGSRESYKDKPWIDLSYPTTLEVVAWMPLLEPYKEESESE